MSEAIVQIEKELAERADRMLAAAGTVEIRDSASLEVANQVSDGLDAVAKRWKAYWKDLVDDAKATYDNVRGRRDSLLKPLEEAREKVRTVVSGYLTEQRRLKDEAERKAFEEEQARIRKSVEANENLELAEMAEAQGDQATAKEFLEKAAVVEKEAAGVVPVVVPARPEMTTAHERTEYDFEVNNVALLPKEFMMANDKAIRAHIVAWKDAKPIPGVTIIKRIIPVKRRGL